MDSLERATVYALIDAIDYKIGKVETTRIMSKTTGSVTLTAADGGVATEDRVLAFDTLILMVEGRANVVINGNTHHVCQGQFIIIPAHFSSHIYSDERYKLLATVMKSGYES